MRWRVVPLVYFPIAYVWYRHFQFPVAWVLYLARERLKERRRRKVAEFITRADRFRRRPQNLEKLRTISRAARRAD